MVNLNSRIMRDDNITGQKNPAKVEQGDFNADDTALKTHVTRWCYFRKKRDNDLIDPDQTNSFISLLLLWNLVFSTSGMNNTQVCFNDRKQLRLR